MITELLDDRVQASLPQLLHRPRGRDRKWPYIVGASWSEGVSQWLSYVPGGFTMRCCFSFLAPRGRPQTILGGAQRKRASKKQIASETLISMSSSSCADPGKGRPRLRERRSHVLAIEARRPRDDDDDKTSSNKSLAAGG